MASLRDIRRRIKSVENTRKITRAMEMVAGARLKQLEVAASKARPYAEGLKSLLSRLLAENPDRRHPLFASSQDGEMTERGAVRRTRTVLALVTSDTGLCGSYNADLVKEAEHLIEAKGRDQVDLITVGVYGNEYFRRRGLDSVRSFLDFKSRVTSERVEEVVRAVTELYTGESVKDVILVSSAFRSAASYGPRRMRFLGLEVDLQPAHPQAYPSLLEPNASQILDALVPRVLQALMRQVLLEAFSAEQAARMMAMRNATDNADEMIKGLTLTRNKVRQAQITKEIIEVISGAEGFKS